MRAIFKIKCEKMQTRAIFILLQLCCLLFYTSGHFSYKYRNRNRSRGSLYNAQNAQALVLTESSSSNNQSPTNINHHQSQIECDFLNHKETGCEDEIGSRCDPNTSKCVCKDSHPVRLLDFCLKISRLNGPCYTSAQCVIANASCYIFGKEYDLETSSGGHNLGRLVKNWPLGICKCRLGFAYNLTTNLCEKRIIGSWCNHDKHCLLRSLNSICDKKRGECECAWGTRYLPKLDSCVPDTTPANTLDNISSVNANNYGFSRQVFYMAKCEQDSDCQLFTSPNSQQIVSSSSSGISSTISTSISVSTVSFLSSQPSVLVKSSSTSPSTQLNSVNLLHQPNVQIENNLILEQVDQENQFNQLRYLHGHRRLKDNSKRLTNYHFRELQCIRGRCACPILYTFDGMHCKELYDTTISHNSSHRHNRKNHNTLNDLDEEFSDELDDSSANWQTIFLLSIGSSLFAGFIFRYCYYRKGEDDDELSEGLGSPEGLRTHKTTLDREHPFNPVTVAFLSKPSVNGSSCGDHYGAPSYGYISSSSSGCYHHDFSHPYHSPRGVCGGLPPIHSVSTNNQMRGHSQTNNTLGKPPNEEDEDAYLEQNPEERDNYEKKDEDLLDMNKYGCVQCGQMRNNLSTNHSAAELQVGNQECCGCNCASLNTLNIKDIKPSIDTTLTRAILEQYGNESVAGDSLNSNVGLRDAMDCVTPATTTTTTCGQTSSGNTTNNEEEDDDHNKSANESSNLENDLKGEHLSNLLTQATNNLHSSFIKQGDLISEEDSNEDTSDEHIAILNRKTRKDHIKKWRSSSSSAELIRNLSSDPKSSPNKNNKSNISLIIESQAEKFGEKFQIA